MHRSRWGRQRLLFCCCAAFLVAPLHAQRARPPEAGGRISSLGQPIRWHWQGGIAGGPFDAGASSDMLLRAHVGVSHHLLNPIAGLAQFSLEAYAGSRGTSADGGVQAIVLVPFLGLGVGADYNFQINAVDALITAQSPVRRGGLLNRGSMLRLDWYPARNKSFTLGLFAPLGDKLAGRGRPVRDHVVVANDFQPRVPYDVDEQQLDDGLDSLRVSAEWIRREVAPFLDQDGRDGIVALKRTNTYLNELRLRLTQRNAEQEVRYFHSQLVQLFTLAAAGPGGPEIAARAQTVLLDEVILPYNSMLGRKKHKDTLAELGTAARGHFSRWLVSSRLVRSERIDPVLYAFQQVTRIMDDVRRSAAEEWADPRLVWLPLQYALLPEQHDEQAELDDLLQRATNVQFTDHNRVVYVTNLQFHWELLRTIRETKRYHVLWIHDFPAVTPTGAMDWGSLAQVIDGYLTTLAERVEAYDSTGALPSYFIFADEHYYEERQSRILMSVLEDPLHAIAKLPASAKAEAARLEQVQERLRNAVARSKVLTAETRQYGDQWLRNRIKVHVNITNRADPSFWSGGLVSSLFGYPDDVMRDHRKIVFHDVDENDPGAGLAILTGTGVGQAYLGPSWDDRSLMIQGPVLFELKRAARDLLMSQGMPEDAIPIFLQSSATPVEREALVTLGQGFDARALTLVNGTGYLPKPLNVGKALLYSLLPPGSVMKIPDSLWNSTFYAGLLVGACLRGGVVSIIAPAQANAPSDGFPQMARAHELFTRLILAQNVLNDVLARAHGHLRTGLYALETDRDGFASRAEGWLKGLSNNAFLPEDMLLARKLSPAVAAVSAKTLTKSAADSIETRGLRPPRLHQKVQFFATRELWQAIAGAPEWPLFMESYLSYRKATYSVGAQSAEALRLSALLSRTAERIFEHTHSTSRALSYAIVGSQNQDYRGMFMDGEVAVLFSGPGSLLPLVDLIFMEGTVTWLQDQKTLDRLLPAPGELKRRLGRFAKDGV